MESTDSHRILQREERYVEKIKNDVDERLYDLLIYHTRDVHDKIRIHGEDNTEIRDMFVKTIEKAIRKLSKATTKYNRREYSRYIIMCCNTLLKFDTGRQDIKNVKKRIIEEFTQSEEDSEGHIPLDYQMNEVRITHDVDYLAYLVKKYCTKEWWHTALYCLIAVELIEPDIEWLEDARKNIHEHLEHNIPPAQSPLSPRGRMVLLDANIALALITGDIGTYRFHTRPEVDVQRLTDMCDARISPAVAAELGAHVSFLEVGIRKYCRKHDDIDAYETCAALRKRLEGAVASYSIEVPHIGAEELEPIRSLYYEYIPALEQVFHAKSKSLPMSQKLRKLAQRVDLLPEEGDIRLLAEAIMLNKAGTPVSICSQDKDFLYFAQPIADTFSIDICSPDSSF